MEGISIKRRHLDTQAWRELLRRFEASGTSVVAFCKHEGVSTNSFRRWRSRLATAPSSQAVPQREAPQEQAARSFIELGSLGGAGVPSVPASRLDLKLDLGGGLSLHLVRG